MYFIVAILVFISVIVLLGIAMDKNIVKPTSPYHRDEEDWVKLKLGISILAFIAGIAWPIILAGLIFVGLVLVILKITGFLLAVGNRFKKE